MNDERADITKKIAHDYTDGLQKGWQDKECYAERGIMFYELAAALKVYGVLQHQPEREVVVWFPAANLQLETRIFASALGKDQKYRFIGGDIAGELVTEGKKRADATVKKNTDFVIGTAALPPFSDSIDVIVDFGGAIWYAAYNNVYYETYHPNNAVSPGFIFCEYHKALKKGGCLVLDSCSWEKCGHDSTMKVLRQSDPKTFGAIEKSDEVVFRAPGHTETVSSGKLEVGEYYARFRKSVVKIEEGCELYLFEKM